MYHPPTPEACESAASSGFEALQWRMTRPCALAPRQLLQSYAALVIFSAAIALPFGWFGLWLIPLCCLLEISVAGALYFCYMIHVTDGEQITFSPDGSLAIDVMRGLKTQHYCINPAWAHLERGGAQLERLWLCCSPLRVEVATRLAAKDRRRIEKELQRALAAMHAGQLSAGPPPSAICS
ncbi:MAG: DUF2244 domain-containing protein [Polaromonas sp.]